jgi:hypothetical protein
VSLFSQSSIEVFLKKTPGKAASLPDAISSTSQLFLVRNSPDALLSVL